MPGIFCQNLYFSFFAGCRARSETSGNANQRMALAHWYWNPELLITDPTDYFPHFPPCSGPGLRHLWDTAYGRRVSTKPVMLDGLDQPNQCVQVGWLNEVGICAEIIGPVNILGQQRRSKHDHGQAFQIGLLADPGEHIQPRDRRQLNIEEHACRGGLGVAITQPRNGFLAIRSDIQSYRHAGLAKRQPNEHDVIRVIFNVENSMLHWNWGLPRAIRPKSGCPDRVAIPPRRARPTARRLCAQVPVRYRCPDTFDCPGGAGTGRKSFHDAA